MWDKIVGFAKTLGVEKIGVCPYVRGRYLLPGKSCNIKEECDFKSVIACLFPYYVRNERGNIAMYARGHDYHAVALDKLKRIIGFINNTSPTVNHPQVDIGVFDERAIAVRAGLGFIGKNRLLINPNFGSYTVIGLIFTGLTLCGGEQAVFDGCGDCEACVGCGDCVSHITQKRGVLDSKEEFLIKKENTCFGCDLCQRVCPYNAGLETTALPEFLSERIASLSLCDIENLSNKEFSEKYKKYAFAWRGKGVLLRNLKILSG